METNLQTYSLPKVLTHYARYSSQLQAPEYAVFKLLKPQLPKIKMLDIGVGGGRTTTFFAPLVKEYIGIDFSKGMINICNEKFKNIFPSVKFEVCDVRDLSRFSTGYFDFVLFSFNGIDNITHEERLIALKEIKRICAPNAYFCFSSHNLQSLPDFFKIHFRLHPVKFLKSLFGRKKLIELNKEEISKLSFAEYVNIYDDVYDFGLHTHYVRPSSQVDQLKELGFNMIKLFSLENGTELTQPEQWNHTMDSWIYYLCNVDLMLY